MRGISIVAAAAALLLVAAAPAGERWTRPVETAMGEAIDLRLFR